MTLSTLTSLISSTSISLFLTRVVLELVSRPLPRPLVLAVGLVAALAGAALGHWATARSRSTVVGHWSALFLLVYVLWPRRDLSVAASVATLMVLLWLLDRERLPSRRRDAHKETGALLVDGLTFAVALAVYVATAAPDVLPADFGEFQLVAALLGVAHPFGFPLYTLVGHVFIRLFPWGTPAYRLNVMSGLLAAGTLVLVARATRLWARRLGATPRLTIAGGLAAALTLGTATTFWAQATIANVRTPAVFLAALALYALARFGAADERAEADRALTLLGLALGLGGGHYPPLAFVSLFFVSYVLLIDPRLVVQPRRWWRPLGIGFLGFLLPLAYLPIRGAMGAPLAPEDLDTLPGFLHHFLALGFGGDMFAFANAADLPHRLSLLPTLFLFQFNLPLLLACLLSLVLLIRCDWRLLILLAGSLILHTFISITYRAPQTVEYLMPAYLPVAIAVGLLPSLVCYWTRALAPPFRLKRRKTTVFLCALVLWAGLLNGRSHAVSFFSLARDRTARRTVAPLLEQAPADALILADWRWATPLWYLQQVEGVRPDVEVRYVYPVAEEEYWETWLRHVQQEASGRPVLLTHYYNFPGYTAEAWASGFFIRPRPVVEPMAPLTAVDATFGDRVEVVGYGLRQRQFHPGQVAEFVLAWRPVGSPDSASSQQGAGGNVSFTLRLVNAAGEYVAQVDRALGTDVAPGELRFERLTLPLYPALSPGRYRVSLGAYTVTDAGFEDLSAGDGDAEEVSKATIALTELDLVSQRCAGWANGHGFTGERDSPSVPFTLHRRSVPFAGGPTLVGVDYDRSVPDVLRVYMHWRGSADAADRGRSGSMSAEYHAGDTWQVRVRTSDGLEAVAPLPSMPAGACYTVGVDLKLPGPEAPNAADADRTRSGSMSADAADRRRSGSMSARSTLLSLRLSLIGEQGQTKAAAGPWGWTAREVRLPTPSSDARFVPLGDEMAVIGFEAGRPRPSRSDAAGDALAVDVTLVALRPLTSDVAISVRLKDAEGRWLARHDMQPALSAVPTLKWVRGSRVVDRHVLALPEDFSGAQVEATLVAYERFRMTPLPPMDGRFGEVPLDTWTLP